MDTPKPFHYFDFLEVIPPRAKFTDEEHSHVILMLKTIEMRVLHDYPAGSFCSAIVAEDFVSAMQHADYINEKFIFLYREFREYLKEFES